VGGVTVGLYAPREADPVGIHMPILFIRWEDLKKNLTEDKREDLIRVIEDRNFFSYFLNFNGTGSQLHSRSQNLQEKRPGRIKRLKRVSKEIRPLLRRVLQEPKLEEKTIL
jgi:hypothetical protein